MQSQFLGYFSTKAFFKAFPLINLAARKFPFEGHAHCRASLRGKDKPMSFNDGAGNVDMLTWSYKAIEAAVAVQSAP